MPGVGVVPGLNGFLSSAGLGIPGVEDGPLGVTLAFVGKPAAFAGIGTGLTEIPGGMFAGSSFITVFELILPPRSEPAKP